MIVKHCVTRKDGRSALVKCYSVLVDYMNPTPILFKMNEEGILRRSVIRDIVENPTTSEKNRHLIQRIKSRDVSVYLHFKRFLRDTNQEPILQLLEIAQKGEDTREAIDMIKQSAAELNDQDNILLRELAATIKMSNLERKKEICSLYILLGKQVCRALFEKQVNDLRPNYHDALTWTIDPFLEMNSENIKPILTEENTHLLFPKAKPELWNMSLFCQLLINTKCNISGPLKLCLKWLLEQGTEIGFYNDENFEHKFEQMKEYLKTIAAETHDKDLVRKVNEFIEPLKDGVFPNTCCADISRKIDLLSEELRHSTKANEHQLQKVIKGNSRMLELLGEIREIVGNSSQSNDVLPKSKQDVPVKIQLKNISQETEEVTSKQIVETSNKPQEAPSKILDAIEDLKKKCKENGYSVAKEFEVGCVQMYIRCTSPASLFSLLSDYVSGKLDAALEQLEKAVRLLDGCQSVKLETVIFEEDILNILSSFNVRPLEINSKEVCQDKSDNFEANTTELVDNGRRNEDLMNETKAESQVVSDNLGATSQPKTRLHQNENSVSENDRLEDACPLQINTYDVCEVKVEHSEAIRADLVDTVAMEKDLMIASTAGSQHLPEIRLQSKENSLPTVNSVSGNDPLQDVRPLEIKTYDICEVKLDTSDANTTELVDTVELREYLMNAKTTESQRLPESATQTEFRLQSKEMKWPQENSVYGNDPLQGISKV